MSFREPAPSLAERRVAIASHDEELVRRLEAGCRRLGHRVEPTIDPRQLIPSLKRLGGSVELVLLDAHLLSAGGRLLEEITHLEDPPAVLLVAPVSAPSRAYDWIERGAADVVGRPPHPTELRLRIRRVLEARDMGAHIAGLEREIADRTRQAFADRTLVAHSPAMRDLASTIGRVARMRTTVLVLGESGVGKELVARAIHFRSPRADGPFIAINCAALPPHLIESELFGHEKGAFTGAVSRRAGKFELAHRGTLFLDEVGETDLGTQAKLLRVLEQQEFMRVGGTQSVRVDVRVVAATNADLERLVAEGQFREDLYYRLKVVALRVPPLRERREDIPELTSQVLERVCRANGLAPRRLAEGAERALLAYSWPGNVRELLNTIEAVVVSSAGEVVEAADLPAALQREAPRAAGRRPAGSARALREIEAEAIVAALAAEGGSRTRAAAVLGIGLRTLRRRINELGLDKDSPPRPGRPRRRTE